MGGLRSPDAQWITVHEAQAGELVQFGHRYSSDADNRIAISFGANLRRRPAPGV
jgi:hypothetical protein